MTENDTDEAIGVDLTEEEKDLNWMRYGPEDARERFHEWSDEKVRERLEEIKNKLSTRD